MNGLDKKGIEPIKRENQQIRGPPPEQEFSDDSDEDEGMPLADDKQGENGEIEGLVDLDTDFIKIYNEANKKQ